MKNLIFILSVCLLCFTCEFERKSNYLLLNNPTQTQKFSIDQNADVILRGEKGTLVEIRKHSFVDENGRPVENVDISLEEYYSVYDFIANRLSTKTTDGKLLKSSGMVDIQVSSDGKEVFLKEGATVKLGFPRVQNSRVANLFTGVNGPNDEIIWELAEPVHLDTTVYRVETIEILKYGAEKVTIYLSAIVGYDTIDINEVNYKYFQQYPRITITNFIGEEVIDTADVFIEGAYFRRETYFIFESTDLGLVNCDIFIDQELFPFVVQTGNSQSDVFIVLDGLNSVIFPDYNPDNDETYQFSLPTDIPITVVAYSREKDSHLFAMEKIVSSKSKISLNLQASEMDEIENIIGGLN